MALAPEKEDEPFRPTLLKSATYLVSLSMQLATFAINYQGHPFRESLRENKALAKSIMIVGGVTLAAAIEFVPELNRWMELVVFPEGFSLRLVGIIAFDWGCCAAIEYGAWSLFGYGSK